MENRLKGAFASIEFVGLQALSLILLLVAIGLAMKTIKFQKRLNRYGSHSAQMNGLGAPFGEQSLKRMAEMGFKLNPYERFERRYWIESGMREKLPWVPSGFMVLICTVTGVLFSIGSYKLFLVKGIAFSGFWLGVLTPLQLIEWYIYYQNKLIIHELPTFFGILTRWAQINPDVIFCLSKLEQSGLRVKLTEPYTKFIRACDSGASTSMAFKQLELAFHLRIMAHFCKCLQEVLHNRGDVVKLLEAFEEESYQIQLEESNRNALQMKYKLLINGLCLISFVLIYFLLKTNQVLSSFYIETMMGQILISGLSLLVVGSFVVSLNTRRTQI